jgi:aminopeptidase YwaD
MLNCFKTMKYFLSFLGLLTIGNLFAQQKDYARQVLNDLCSPNMHGRGYVNGGDRIAAEYIAAQYNSIGLQTYGDDYFQRFQVPVNSITGKLRLLVNGLELRPGIDYIVHPSSPRTKGTYPCQYFHKKGVKNAGSILSEVMHAYGKYLVIDRNRFKNEKEINAKLSKATQFLLRQTEFELAGVVVIKRLDEKLVWSGSQSVSPRPLIEIDAHAIQGKVKEIEVSIENKYYDRYPARNVIGFIEGKDQSKTLMLTAHYDHLGRMGDKTYFPGASDNASGVAMLLSLAKHFSDPENKPPYNMAFVCFAAEEIGILGSKFYTENPLFPLEDIRLLFNLDIMGTGDDGIQVVNGTIYKDQFDRLVATNEAGGYLKQVKIRGERCNSDHCFFHEKGVPSFFSYTLGGKAEYHNVYDTSESLSLSKFEDVFKLLADYLSKP